MSSADEAEQTTHLADRYPQIDTPLRVEPPPGMKAPERVDTPSLDVQICRSAYSPRAFVMRRTLLTHLSAEGAVAESLLTPGTRAAREMMSRLPETSSAALGNFKTEVSNYQMLAFSSQRAGKLEMEAQAYMAVGILNDNVRSFEVALTAYKQFAAVAQKLGDKLAEGLAYNCAGVDCMVSARGESAQFGAARTLSKSAKLSITKAVDHHMAHLAVADDGGRFVASTNLGLCHGALGDALAAARHHQEALRIAISLQSSSGQSISVGNLGSLAMRQGDYATARPCLEQHLQLVQALRDHGAEIHAWMQLGHLALAKDDHDHALYNFEAAARIADHHGELGTLKRANCYIGLAKGKLTQADYFTTLTDNLQQHAKEQEQEEKNRQKKLPEQQLVLEEQQQQLQLEQQQQAAEAAAAAAAQTEPQPAE